MAAEFNNDNFENEVLGADQPVLVDFWSEGCPPCKRLVPVIDALAEANDSAKIGKVNVSENMDLAVKFGITAVPTILVFKNGDVVERAQGYQDQEHLQSMINAHIA